MQKAISITAGAAGFLALAGAAGTAAYAWNNTTYHARAVARVRSAGFAERQATVDGSVINYGEGPTHVTPLLLIHGQMTSWQSYAPVLPELARRFHVYAVDCYGHGQSSHDPTGYSAAANGRDLRRFIRDVIGRPAIVSGLSSGGLLAGWLGANAPAEVRAVILEDPPFFSSLPDRFPRTAGYELASIAHAFLESGESDFAVYYATHMGWLDYLGKLRPAMLAYPARFRAQHPGRPLTYWFFPPLVNSLFESLDQYDPRFGQAFYDYSWHEGFDHADALARLRLPAALIHANWFVDPKGILMGAMNDEDASRACRLIEGVEFHRVDSLHSVHTAEPKTFLHIVNEFADRLHL